MLDLHDDYPEILGIIAQGVYDLLITLKVSPEIASEHSLMISEDIRKKIGGVGIYIPKGDRFVASKRDLEIFSAFDGTNYARLAKENSLTEMRIRQIIQAFRSAEIKRRQSDLF